MWDDARRAFRKSVLEKVESPQERVPQAAKGPRCIGTRPCFRRYKRRTGSKLPVAPDEGDPVVLDF